MNERSEAQEWMGGVRPLRFSQVHLEPFQRTPRQTQLPRPLKEKPDGSSVYGMFGGPIGTRRTNGPLRRHLVLLAVSLGHIKAASLKRPSSSKFNIDFEADGDVGLPCDFSEGDVVKEQYASKMALFSGPGFGGLNGGVRTGGCAVGRGDLPPLSNASFKGLGLLGFSTLHMLSDGRTGKPVSPETVRFDVRMTNIRLGVAALDGNDITVELCAARRHHYPRRCRLLPCQPSPLMTG